MTGDYAASFLPLVLVPGIGIVIAAVTMALLFTYIESEAEG